MKSHASLNEMAKLFHPKVTWVPGHSTIEANYNADESARLETKLADEYTDNDVRMGADLRPSF